MDINNKKNHLSRISVFFIMLLFAMCLTMNVLLCSTYNLYELIDKTTEIGTWEISEYNIINEEADHTTDFKASFLNNNNSYKKTITKNICTFSIIEAYPKGISLLLFLIIVFFFLTIFILLPDGWTLVNQKVRLDN